MSAAFGRMKSPQLIGLFLWRAGLLLAGGWGLYLSFGWMLGYLRVPPLAAAGIALILTGCALVMGSLIAERVADARAEGDLTA